MGSLSGFNAASVQPMDDFDAIPAGEYAAMITGSEWRDTKSGVGRYLRIELTVQEGEHKGRKLWDNLNLENPNGQAVEIARRTLSSICYAVDVMTPEDVNDFYGRLMTIKVVVKSDPGYSPSNQVKAYKKYQAGGESLNTQQSNTPPWRAS